MSSRWGSAVGRVLSLRLGIWYAGIFAASAAALLLASYVLLARALVTQDHAVLASMLTRYATEYDRAGLGGLVRTAELDEHQGRHERLVVRVASRTDAVVYLAQPPEFGPVDVSILERAAVVPWATVDNPADGASLEVGTVRLAGGVVVQVARSSRARDQLLDNFRSRVIELGLAIAVLAIAGAFVITGIALAPIRSMETTVSTILATRRFDARVETRGDDDPLDRLGGQINEMLGRIERLVGSMRATLDHVAHDLRTPLTRFRNAADSALVSNDPVAWHEALVSATEEADRLRATLTALLDIAESESGTMTLRIETGPLAPIVTEAIALYADEGEDRGVLVEADVAGTIVVRADRTRLRQVLANLVENAVKYTEGPGRVTVRAAPVADGRTVAIEVQDTGPGITPGDLPLIWDRLYRGTQTRSTRGLGLGLSLVKAIVEAHGGTVAVTSTVGQGSTFTVTMPADGSNLSPM